MKSIQDINRKSLLNLRYYSSEEKKNKNNIRNKNSVIDYKWIENTLIELNQQNISFLFVIIREGKPVYTENYGTSTLSFEKIMSEICSKVDIPNIELCIIEPSMQSVKVNKRIHNNKCIYDGFQLKHLYHHNNLKEIQRDFIQIHKHRKLNLLNVRKSKKNIAIITIYRDNTTHEREKQKNEFIDKINILFQPYCNFHIYIIEQSEDGKGFNIGKTKNIGFEIAFNSDIQFDHYIFTDIDMIPNYDLMKYYIKNPKNGVLSLANRGSRWSKKTIDEVFFGGAFNINGKIFKKINGFANNFWGWGGEDRNLIIRSCLKQIPNYKPRDGDMINIEEYNQKTINIKQKLKLVNSDRDKLVVEKLYIDLTNYMSNGLNHLKYKIIKRDKISSTIDLIKVDLLYENDYKNHKEWFPQKFNENKYQNAKDKIVEIVQEYRMYSSIIE